MIPEEVKKIGEDRFQSQKDWEKTLTFFRQVYDDKPGIVWTRIATGTKVANARHIENTQPKRTWEGINLYETGGKVFIFVIKTNPEKN